MLKILDHAWHQAHSYRLHALPATFEYYPVGSRYWEPSIRPRPDNFRGIISRDELADRYDVILSHLDNWVIGSPLRATPFRAMNIIAQRYPNAARVCIMHGTPDNPENKAAVNRLIDSSPGGPPFLVCNSQQAYREWGRGPDRSRAIIHGYDTSEFHSDLRKMKIAATVCSAGPVSREYHGVPMLERIKRDVDVMWVGMNGDKDYFSSYREYRDFLASLLIYVHCGKRSPMPGARTEAMLSGACVVTTSNHDANKVFDHKLNGFLCDTAQEMIDTIKMLLADPHRAFAVGRRGREDAQVMFGKGRFVRDWLGLLGDLGVKRE